MLSVLPPVRRRVPAKGRGTPPLLEPLFPGHAVCLTGSGTEALALALADARLCSSAPHPEVILPAYGCPDLVAASLYAGVRPRLVDTARGQWGYDLERLRAAVSPDTVAVVAVNLMGVGDQAGALRELATDCGIALIQDSAQHLPRRLPATWTGDYVVLSFGRGKPLNLLRGGALVRTLSRRDSIADTVGGDPGGVKEWLLSGRLAAIAFSAATHPLAYGLLRHLPGAGVGRTEYRALKTIHRASSALTAQVRWGLKGYCDEPGYDASIWDDACREWISAGIQPLSCAGERPGDPLKLRVALLAADEPACAALVAALNDSGAGASRFYGVPLNRIPGIPEEVTDQGPFPNAEDLARRLFTLPTHSCVSSKAVHRAREAVRKVLPC